MSIRIAVILLAVGAATVAVAMSRVHDTPPAAAPQEDAIDLPAVLSRRVGPMSLEPATFGQAIQTLRRQARVNIAVDWLGMQMSGVAPDTPLRIQSLGDLRLDQVLRMLSDDAGQGESFECWSEHGILMLSCSSNDRLPRPAMRCYDIRDLMNAGQARRVSGANDTGYTMAQFIWHDVGGVSWAGDSGEVSISQINDILIITGRPENHRRVEQVLASLRRSWLSRPAPATARRAP